MTDTTSPEFHTPYALTRLGHDAPRIFDWHPRGVIAPDAPRYRTRGTIMLREVSGTGTTYLRLRGAPANVLPKHDLGPFLVAVQADNKFAEGQDVDVLGPVFRNPRGEVGLLAEQVTVVVQS